MFSWIKPTMGQELDCHIKIKHKCWSLFLARHSWNVVSIIYKNYYTLLQKTNHNWHLIKEKAQKHAQYQRNYFMNLIPYLYLSQLEAWHKKIEKNGEIKL
jgi:hypothetical protein